MTEKGEGGPRQPGPWWGPIPGALAVFALSCLVFAASMRVVANPPAWFTFEFCQYAEIGRNLAETGRFATRVVEPMALAVLDAEPKRPGADAPGLWPVVNRYPLPCWVIAGLMRLMGPTDRAAAWSNGIAAALLGAIGYAAAYRGLGRAWAALFAVVYLANPAFFGEFILLGTPDAWFAAIFVAQLWLWSEWDPADPRPTRWRWAIGFGVLSGLAFLARFNATLLLAVQGIALLLRGRWREGLIATGVAVLVAAPMFAYNLRHFGRPMVSIYSAWNLLDRIGAYRVEPWLYYRVPSLWYELSLHLDGVGRKVAENLLEIVPARVWNLWRLDILFPVAIVAAGLARRTSAAGRFAIWSTGLFVLQLVAFGGMRLELEPSVSPHHGRYFYWYAVPAVLVALGAFRRLTERSGYWWLAIAWYSVPAALVAIGAFGRFAEWPRWWLIVAWYAVPAAFVAIGAIRRRSDRSQWLWHLAAASLLVQFGLFARDWREIPAHHRDPTNLGHDPIRKALGEVAAGRVVASNQPQITAWFNGLRSISLPADPDELAALNERSPTPADFLFIDLNYNCIDLDPKWAMIASNRRVVSPWEPGLLRDYEYVLPPERTRPIYQYVMLRRRSLPPSPAEQAIRSQIR